MTQRPLLKDWIKLREAVGGHKQLCELLEVAPTTLDHWMRAQTPVPEDKRRLLESICDVYGVDNPVKRAPKPWARDLRRLKDLGNRLEMGFPVAKRELKELRDMYPEDQLVKLAEADAGEKIHRAVQFLLEEA